MAMLSTFDIVKLQSFDSTEFHCWKLHVQLGMKERGIFYTVLSEYATTREGVNKFQWNKDEDFCRDYLLNSLNVRLAMIYSQYKTAKEIWDRLNAHFQKQNELSKTLLAEKFFDLKFNMNSTVSSQLIELENMRNKLKDDKSDMSDNLFVYLILSKLPPEWNTFKIEMHGLKKQIGLDELKWFIYIEDQNFVRKCTEQSSQPIQVDNLVLHSSKPQRNPPAPVGESSLQLQVKKTSFKRKRGKCHNCGKWGHWAADCKLPQKSKEDTPQNKADMLTDKSEPQSFIAMMGSSHSSGSSE
ncbi:hypothetical protein KSP39_PZI019801 [Platanthera zijinensis]|uniref:CCHC-type domain-containing protein n=1 Tax=Platanthera zijinensis TaxID=2320716 RepID=A0AAP0FY36_9ASPA